MVQSNLVTIKSLIPKHSMTTTKCDLCVYTHNPYADLESSVTVDKNCPKTNQIYPFLILLFSHTHFAALRALL